MSISSRTSEGEISETDVQPSEKILIGRVISAHGLRGGINVLPLTDYPERFETMDVITLYREERPWRSVKVRGVRFNEGKNVLTLKTNLADRDEAEACVGMDILIAPEERVALPEDSFWVDDLIGLAVEDVGGRPLGQVEDFITGANELYVIRDPVGALHYIPAVREFVREINIEEGRIRVALIEGLWD